MKKGERTKLKILSNAKEEFFHYGYNKASMQHIADRSEIALGSLSYYFPQKSDIANTILRDYIYKIYNYVEENMEEEYDALFKHFIVSIPFYKNLLLDEHTSIFYGELLRSMSLYSIDKSPTSLSQFLGTVRILILNDYRMKSDEADSFNNQFEIGGRHYMLLRHLHGTYDDIPIERFINDLSIKMGILMGIDREILDRAARTAVEFDQKHDMSHIHPLV